MSTLHRYAACPRCDTTHDLDFVPLTRPAGPYTLWAICSATGQPVLGLEKPMSLVNFIRQYASRWPRYTHG